MDGSEQEEARDVVTQSGPAEEVFPKMAVAWRAGNRVGRSS